jgi:NhaP-type Na+/H+ or K+/H+ antiporter
MHEGLDSPGLTVALAMAIGVLAQGLARHVRLPGIVVLLFAGVLLGPDFADLIRPETLGTGLPILISFAVAVILFEGGLKLNLKHLRKQAKPIRRLVSIGALVTAIGGALLARFVMGWEWGLAALFGTLVIVTGPTVINPLLRRIRLNQDLTTILEAEGIFIDAVGATIAVVALEVVLAPSAESVGHGIIDVAGRIGTGALIGAIGGGLLALLLYWKPVVPEGLHNVLGLGFSVAIFQVSNSLLEESGITAAIMAGLVVGNIRVQHQEELVEFKEQLTTFFIATLFVLLSADVRMEDVQALGWPALLTVGLLMVVIRPLTVAASTYNTELSFKDKAFLSWLAPRGIVAAAVGSLFASELEAAGVEGGLPVRALVFLVIAVTVTVQGLSGGPIAGLLGVRRPKNAGYAILGANVVGIHLAQMLREGGQEVVFIDANPDQVRNAQDAGFKVIYGNGLQERTLLRARLDHRAGAIAATENENVNFLFAKKVKEGFPSVKLHIALETGESGVTEKMVEDLGGEVLFGRARRVGLWRTRMRAKDAVIERWRYERPQEHLELDHAPVGMILALGVLRNTQAVLVDRHLELVEGDIAEFAFHPGKHEEAQKWLRQVGWSRMEGPEPVLGSQEELGR